MNVIIGIIVAILSLILIYKGLSSIYSEENLKWYYVIKAIGGGFFGLILVYLLLMNLVKLN